MLQKLFGFDPSTMTLRKEVMGGITTFLTMAYILAVNPSLVWMLVLCLPQHVSRL